MSDRLTGYIILDASESFSEIDKLMNMLDAAAKRAHTVRQEVIRGVREGFRMVNSLLSSYREAMSIMGQTIDPFFDALLSIVAATVSLLLSVATGLLATGVGGAAAAVVAGIAIGLNIITTANLIRSKIEIMARLAELGHKMSRLTPTTPMGVSF